MRASLSLLAWTVAAALLLLPRPLAAQTPIPPRLDISGAVGWFANDRELPGGPFYDDDTQHRWVFGGDVGLYWNEHLKSEVGSSATTTGSSFVLVPIAPSREGAYPYASGHRRTREVRVVAQQIYQFGHNAWVHPYVGAGVVVLRETSRLEFDQTPLANPELLVPPSQRAETVTRVKPVVSAGFKAYFSPRTFVRGDILLSPWTTSRDVTVRGGIGVDLK
jgi:hypothetical protein